MEDIIKQDKHKSKSYEEFKKLLAAVAEKTNLKEGSITNAVIREVGKKFIVVDIPNGKQESYIPISEFQGSDELKNLEINKEIPVVIERLESAKGEVICSFQLAKKRMVWKKLESAYAEKKIISGKLLSKVKSGWAVDLNGCIAFLPNSCLDLYPLKSVDHLKNIDLKFLIEKMARGRSNIIVSRRAVLELEKKKTRDQTISKLKVGDVITVKAKSVVSYGVFCSYENMDCLLHLTQMSFGRVEHPEELASVGDEIRVKIIGIEDGKISVSTKALSKDPWENIDQIKLNSIHTGRCIKVVNYGAFIEFDKFSSLIGLVYKDELSFFNNKNKNPSKVISKSEACKFKVIGIDKENRKLSLSLKKAEEASPWEILKKNHPVGTKVKIKIVSCTDFGIFGQIETSECVALIHKNELHFSNNPDEELKKYKKGMSNISCILKEIDSENQKIRASIREAMGPDPFSALDKYKKNDVVTCIVSSIQAPKGIKVKIGNQKGFEVQIPKRDLSKEPENQRISRFQVGDRHDALIISLDKITRKCILSIRALEEQEEKKILKKYKSTSSGGVLGSILGPILKKDKPKKEK